MKPPRVLPGVVPRVSPRVLPRVLPLTRWLLAAAGLTLLAAAVDAGLWWRDAGRNAQIASGRVPADSPVPELQFAHAQALSAAIGPGGSSDAAAIDRALNAWRPLQAHPQLGTAARYNSANLLLRQASAVRGRQVSAPGADQAGASGGGQNSASGGGQGSASGEGQGSASGEGRGSASGAGARADQALPLLELAKEQYRELLRRDPGFWDARYNLERAQRLLPDPVDNDLEPTAAQRERERAATRMRAQSLGLP